MRARPTDKDLHRGLVEDEGFSVNERTGRIPRTGVMSSIHGHEAVHPGVASPEQIGDFRSEKAQPLSQPSHFLGGWHDRREDETSLDVSRRFGTVQKGYNFARSQGQKAIFDLGSFSEREVHYGPRLPYRGTGRTPEQQKDAIAEKNTAHREAVRVHLDARASNPVTTEGLRAAGESIADAVWEAERVTDRFRGGGR
jgi:hypothetical protein